MNKKERERETDKSLELALKKQELQTKIIKTIEETIKNWKGLSLEKKAIFVEKIPYEISALPESLQKTAIEELCSADILKKRDLQKNVNLINDLYKKEVAPEPEDKKQKGIKTKTLIPGLIHLVKEDGKVSYLLQNEGKFYIEDTYAGEDGIICKPKGDLPICYCELDILEEPREINYSFLLNDIIKFIKEYLELPEDKGYLILALWVFHTYLMEKFDTTPIIYFYGLKETGKTRAGEVLGELAYKCERLTSPTEATLFRSAEYFKTALIIDEIQLWGKNGNEEVERLIKSRYKRGLKVNRINLNKSGEDQVEYFDVFAPLVISTTYDIPLIIQDRAIRFLMQKNSDPKVERPIDKELAKNLRNKLTIFRADLIESELEEVKPISRRRLNEILSPLYRILKKIGPEREDDFRLVVKNLEEGRKSEEGFSYNAEIIEGIVSFCNEENRQFISTIELTERLNKDKNEDERITINKVGWILKPLGFQKTVKDRKTGYIINIEILNHLIERFNTSRIKVKSEGLFDN